jgi:hypothetical protein
VSVRRATRPSGPEHIQVLKAPQSQTKVRAPPFLGANFEHPASGRIRNLQFGVLLHFSGDPEAAEDRLQFVTEFERQFAETCKGSRAYPESPSFFCIDHVSNTK